MMTSDIKIPWQLASPEDALQTHGGETMCGGVTNKTTRGKPMPRMTLWEAIVILWHEFRKGL